MADNTDYPHFRGVVLANARRRDTALRQRLEDLEQPQDTTMNNNEIQFTERGREGYNMEVARYNHRKRDYDRLQKDAAAFLDWIYQSVSPDYHHLFKDKSLVQIYEVLRDYSQPL